MNPLPILRQDPITAARDLLGWTLTSTIDGRTTAGVIVETEAYRALDDPAAHAYRGITERNRPMWEAAGTVYVYFTYGMHYMMNLATGPKGAAEAVLIRALEPTVGLETMLGRRGVRKPVLATNGPGKLTQALGITLAQTGSTIGNELILTPPPEGWTEPVTTTTRIGISQGKELPWRFYITDNPYVSRK